MSLPVFEAQFAISEVGETTGEKFTGMFTVKRVLSKREESLADIRRRAILGPQPENSLSSVANDAYVLGQLAVRIVKAPKWWDESDGGLDLLDSNVLAKIFEETLKAEIEFRKEIAEKTGDAEKVLEKTVQKSVENAALSEEIKGE